MKKLHLILLVAVTMLAISFTSCEKRRVLNRLEGDWDVTSYIIDGDELIDSETSIRMEYEEADGNEGDVTWILIDDFGSEVLSGEYELNDDADELEITFRDGTDVFIVDAEIDEIEKDELKLEGFIDGAFFVIRADKD